MIYWIFNNPEQFFAILAALSFVLAGFLFIGDMWASDKPEVHSRFFENVECYAQYCF